MRLLITTQKLDKYDPILGFFHSWVAEFAKHCESVHVICLFKGEYDLPENVHVFSLGKEEKQSRIQYLIHFYWFIIHERKKYDTVFVHMNQIYVVLAGFLWKMFGKKIGLWYTHRAVHWTLRVATYFADHIFTASKEGFNIATPKLHIVGHGIDVESFKNPTSRTRKTVEILSVSRITRIKNVDTLIKAVAILAKTGMKFKCTIVGPQVTPDDAKYFGELQNLMKAEGIEKLVTFAGGMTPEKTREYYWKSDINVNLSPTGGIDKVVLEGMAAGLLPFASNAAFADVFGPYSKDLIFTLKDPEDLARKIQAAQARPDREMVVDLLKRKVEQDFSHKTLIKKILSYLS
jgi:glycosyltransferase involved in cell wall biosynthesis